MGVGRVEEEHYTSQHGDPKAELALPLKFYLLIPRDKHAVQDVGVS